jgi:hypothetical protein
MKNKDAMESRLIFRDASAPVRSRVQIVGRFLVYLLLLQAVSACLEEPTDAPELTIVSSSTDEGKMAVFSIQLSFASSKDVLISYKTDGESAQADLDYTEVSGQVLVLAGDTDVSVSIPTLDDSLDEDNERFSLTIIAAENARVPVERAWMEILDNDLASEISVTSVSTLEGQQAKVLATLNKPSGKVITAEYVTIGGTAEADIDFVPLTGSLVFLPGETEKAIIIDTLEDEEVEDLQFFLIRLSELQNASGDVLESHVNIIDNDVLPTLSVADASVDEGGEVQFKIHLSSLSRQDVSFDFLTQGDSATAQIDFTSVKGTGVIPAGQSEVLIRVSTLEDSLYENNETFFLNISNGIQATILDGQGVARIVDNDSPPLISVSDASAEEGQPLEFLVSLNTVSGRDVVVNLATVDGKAKAGEDYLFKSTQLTILSGQTFLKVPIATLNDALYEGPEEFFVQLSEAIHGTIAQSRGVATITDDDEPPLINISSVRVNEDAAEAELAVVLSQLSGLDVSFDYHTVDGTARAGSDYAETHGRITMSAGLSGIKLRVPLKGDTLDEDDEVLRLELSNIVGAQIGNSVGQITIMDNDIEPSVSMENLTVTEGDLGIFKVTLSEVSGRDVHFTVDTLSGEAVSGFDFEPIFAKPFVIPSGQTTMDIVVPTVDDGVKEGLESFYLQFTSVLNATTPRSQAQGYIQDDDICGANTIAQHRDSAVETVGRALAILSPTRWLAVGSGDHKNSERWLSMESKDSGSLWENSDSFQLDKKSIAAAYAVGRDSSNNVYVAGVAGDKSEGGPLQKWIVRRTSGEKKWETLDSYNLVADKDSEAKSMSVDGSDQIWVVGRASDGFSDHWIVRRSGNAGKTWNGYDQYQLAINQNAIAYGVLQSSTGAIFAVGEASIGGRPNWVVRRSLDNGITWSTVDIFQTNGDEDSGARAVAGDRNGVVYVVGHAGNTRAWTVRKSADNGNTWTTVDSYRPVAGEVSGANSLAVSRLGHIVVVGSASNGLAHSALARESRDFGATWITIENFQSQANKASVLYHVLSDGFSNYHFTGMGTDLSGESHMLIRHRNCP